MSEFGTGYVKAVAAHPRARLRAISTSEGTGHVENRAGG